MTLYDINKAAYQNISSIKNIEAIRKTTSNFLREHKSKFYLLLNNENRYVTLFFWKHKNQKGEKRNGFHRLVAEIVDVTTELGPVKDVVENKDTNVLEFWIEYNGEPTLFVLCDYAKGVIEVE